MKIQWKKKYIYIYIFDKKILDLDKFNLYFF